MDYSINNVRFGSISLLIGTINGKRFKTVAGTHVRVWNMRFKSQTGILVTFFFLSFVQATSMCVQDILEGKLHTFFFKSTGANEMDNTLPMSTFTEISIVRTYIILLSDPKNICPLSQFWVKTHILLHLAATKNLQHRIICRWIDSIVTTAVIIFNKRKETEKRKKKMVWNKINPINVQQWYHFAFTYFRLSFLFLSFSLASTVEQTKSMKQFPWQ